MDTTKAELLTRQKLREYGLNGWGFKWSRAKKTLGKCYHAQKTIELSKEFVYLNPEDVVMDTIMHEIAHAIVGPGHGHGYIWRNKARELGVNNPSSYVRPTVQLSYKWEMYCPNCGAVIARHRKTDTKKACARCCRKYNGGKFSTTFMFRWREANSISIGATDEQKP